MNANPNHTTDPNTFSLLESSASNESHAFFATTYPLQGSPSATASTSLNVDIGSNDTSSQDHQGIAMHAPAFQSLEGATQMPPSNSNFPGFMPADLDFGDLHQLQQQLGVQVNQPSSTEDNTSIPQQLHLQQQQTEQDQQSQLSQFQQQQPQAQATPQHTNNTFFQSFVNQKLQYPSIAVMDDQNRQRFLTAPAEPILQPHLFNDPRFSFMGQAGGLGGFSFVSRPQFTLPSPHALSLGDDCRRMRGGVIEPFPEKLHRLLIEVEATGRSDVISFVASGKAFAIHKPDLFFKEIVPKYFRQSRLSSFKRQLNLYGFELINTGPERGGYYHSMFVKDQPGLCRKMRRVAVKMQVSKQVEETPKCSNYVAMPIALRDNDDVNNDIDEIFGINSVRNSAA